MQLIDDDIAEGKKHMTNDFPFEGHRSPVEDLKAIKETTDKESMPPFSYRLMHRGAKPSVEEKKAIWDWISESLKALDVQDSSKEIKY